MFRFLFFLLPSLPIWTKRKMWGDFATFFLFLFKVPRLISGSVAEICLQQFIMARNFFPSCNSSWYFFFSQPPPTSKRGPCQCQLDCNSRRDVWRRACVCVCVVCAGLDQSPALGIFVSINTSLHTFYLSMLWRLEEGVGSPLRRFGLQRGARYLPQTDLWLSATHFPHGALMYLELFLGQAADI